MALASADRAWKRFLVAAACAILASAAFAAVIGLQPFDEDWTTGIDDVGEGVAALLAAAACAWAARRTAGRLRAAWGLLALSALSWTIGEAIWSYFEVWLDDVVPFPGLSDVGFLLAVPFAVAGVLAFSTPPRAETSGWRVWLDGAIVGLSLFCVGWVLDIRHVWRSPDPLAERVFAIAYPIGDIFIATVVILAIRRATRQQQGRMVLLLLGLAANAIADGVFAQMNAAGTFGALGSVFDTGWVVGYLMIALAALWPSSRTDEVAQREPIDIWQAVLPWFAVGGALASFTVLSFEDRAVDPLLGTLAGVIAVLLVLSQLSANRQFLALLVKSQLSEATLADVIARAPVGIARLDAGFRILEANPTMEAIFREPRGAMTGVPIGRYVPAEGAPESAARLASIKSGAAESVDAEVSLVRADGSRVWVHLNTAAVRSEDGTIDYFLAMVQDASAQHESEEAARNAYEVLERLNRLKSEFIQSVSHEFKTALIGIQGFSEFMRDSDELDLRDVRAFASDIYRDAERLDRMIEEMLDLDRVESSHTRLSTTAVDVNALVENEVGEARVRSRGMDFESRLDPALPRAAGDAEKLALVVRTLLDNAVKYSPEHGRITVSSRPVGTHVEVTVADQGTGVRADFDNRLFGASDLYADNPIRKVVGTGLGLGMARQVVEMHGGRIWVDRHDGASGSEFHFTVPAAVGAKVA